LAGHVDSYAEKWNAEKAAQRVTGVKALAIEMDVKLPGSFQRNDADIARAAQNVLEWTTFLPENAIKVKVENGWITLSGQVEWDYKKQAAADAVRYLMGVKGVSSDITIKSTVTKDLVKSDIEAALKRRAANDTQNVKVSVSGSDVTLSGKVHSWSERELAANSAWATPGVRNVSNNIAVSY
jgi:osmotically-inducible protein OsmY